MTIDKDITFFGLEVEDIVLVVFCSAIIMFLISPVLAALFGLVSSIGLRRLKEGKPPGHLYYLIYKSGLILILPGLFRHPHMVKPNSIVDRFLNKSHSIKFSCIGDDYVDSKDNFEKFYWFEKEVL